MCPLDYTAVAGSVNVEPERRYTTPTEWIRSVAIRLAVLSRYRSCRIIGQFKIQFSKTLRLNRNALIFTV